jgi:hypothetical protein
MDLAVRFKGINPVTGLLMQNRSASVVHMEIE